MKKLLWGLIFLAASAAGNAYADRWIVYSATQAIDCSGYLNGGKLTTHGTDTYCSDDTSGALSGDASAITNIPAAQLTGTVPNATIDNSSITKQGNIFNTANKLIQLNGSGVIPALSGANLTSLPAANLTGTVPNASIDDSSITKQGNTFNSGSDLLQLSSGLVPNANVDASSITKMGNTFNGTNQLIQLNGSGVIPALSAANLTSIPAANLAGTVADARLSANVPLLSSTQSFTGAATFSSTVTVRDGSASSPTPRFTSEVTGPFLNGAGNYGFAIAGVGKLSLNGSNLYPVSSGGIGLGTSGFPFGTSYINDLAISNTFSVGSWSIFTGSITATSASNSIGGNGSALTSLNASNITSGTVPNAQIDNSSVTKQGNTLKALDSAVVHLTGTEQIAGAKTFTSGPAITLGTSDNTAYVPWQANAGGNTGYVAFGVYTATSVASVATKIYSTDTHTVAFVSGIDASVNSFTDLVVCGFVAATPVVFSSGTTRGTPAARTYSMGANGALSLAMGSGTYTIKTFGFGTNDR